MKKHLGSTIALIFGGVTFISGIIKASSLIITGPIIILGALAYRSAKKRKLGEVRASLLRKALEIAAIVIIFAAVLLQNDLKHLIATDPVPNLIIPLWAIIAYSIMALKAQNATDEINGMDKND